MHWTRVKISDVLTEREGRYKVTDKALKGLQRIDKIDFDGNVHLSEKPSKTDMIIVHPGDLVISGINVHKGAIAVYEGQVPVAATIHYSSYTFDDRKLRVEYFKEYLKSEAFLKVLKDQVPGGIKTEIKPKHFLPLEIDLPGRKSQNVLLDRFRGIETKRKALTTELTHQRVLLKQLRQAILQEAVQGKLTAAWRGSHPELVSGSYHASELLKRIRTEKETLVKAGKLRKPKPLPPIKPEEVPFELPEGWVWCRLGDITHTITKGSSPRWQAVRYVDESGGILFVTSENVGAGRMLWDNKKYVEKKFNEIEPRSILAKGDLLVNIVGASIGRSAEYDLDEVANVNQAVCLIRLIGEVSHQYILQLLNSPVGVDQMFDRQIDHARANLSMGNIAEFMVPLPPVEEQLVILAAIDAASHKVADLVHEVESVHTITGTLLQSVLSEVMGGPGAVRYVEAGDELPMAAEPQVRRGRAAKASSQVHEGQ